jgi:hypothetical protein
MATTRSATARLTTNMFPERKRFIQHRLVFSTAWIALFSTIIKELFP